MAAGKVDVVITANGVQYTKTLQAAGRAARKFGAEQREMGTASERMAARVKDAYEQVGEKIAEVAERAELSSDGIASGFAGLAGLFGAGAFAGFGAHMLDQLAEMNVELGDLADQTTISVTALAGLHQIVREMGLDWQPVQMGLVRMQRAQVAAVEGEKEYTLAFRDLGLTLKELKSLTPEALLDRLAVRMHDVGTQAIRSNSAIEIFGRSGKVLIPILQEYGAGLKKSMDAEGALTGVTNKSVDASREWTAAINHLDAEIERDLMPSLVHMPAILSSVELAFHAVGDVIGMTFADAYNEIMGVFHAMEDLAGVAGDLWHHQWQHAWADAKGAGEDATNGFRTAVRASKAEMNELEKTAGEIHWTPSTIDHARPSSNVDLSGLLGEDARGRGSRKRNDTALVNGWQRQLDALRSVQSMTLSQESNYWLGRAETVAKGSASYIAALRNADVTAARLHAQFIATSQAFAAMSGGVNPNDTPEQAATRQAAHEHMERMGRLMDQTRLSAQGTAAAGWLRNMREDVDVRHKNADAIAEASIQAAAAAGTMTKLGAAQAIAALHAREYAEAMKDLRDQIAAVQANPTLSDLEKKQKISALEKTGDQEAGARAVQKIHDQQSIYANTAVGYSQDALNKMVADWTSMTDKIGETLSQAVGGINDSLARALVGQKGRREHLSWDIGGSLDAAARGLAKTGIQAIEGEALKRLGLGPKNKPTGASDNPIYTIVTNWAGSSAGAGVLGGILSGSSSPGNSKSKNGSGGILGGLLGSIFGGSNSDGSSDGSDSSGPLNSDEIKKLGGWLEKGGKDIWGGLKDIFQGHFAGGGDVLANRPAIVGELGPELFVPRTPGYIVPHHELMGNVTHHYHIDARGSQDPALTEAAVRRALYAVHHQAVRDSVAATREGIKRQPKNASF